MKVLQTIVRYPLECLSGAAFFTMAIVILIQVIWRYVLRSPLSWPEELARLLFIWASLFGAAIGLKLGSHYRVDFFVDFLPQKVRSIFMLFIDFLLSFIVSYWGWQGIRGLSAPAKQQFAALRISMIWLYLPIPVGCALMLLFLLVKLYRDVRALQ